MNDTPRTDFVELGIPSWQLADNARVLDHARQLERELAECQRRLNEFEHPRDPIDQPTTPPTR